MITDDNYDGFERINDDDDDKMVSEHQHHKQTDQSNQPRWRRGSVVRTSVFGWQTSLIYARSMVDVWPLRG